MMKERKAERIFWGLFLIAAAVVMVVSQLGYFNTEIGIFTIIVTAVLVACLIKSIVHFSIWGLLFSIAFLCIVYAEPLHITAITPWTVLGAALLGSIGFSCIFHKKNHFGHYDHMEFDRNTTVEHLDGDFEQLNTSFGSSIKYVKSDNFQQAAINCSFGAMKIYFDNAMIQNGVADINFNVQFAGVELYIPKEWRIENNAQLSFAAIDEKNRNNSIGSPCLRLNGKVAFGGVTILYV